MGVPLFLFGGHMCNYIKENICTINSTPCPFVYYCDKRKSWRALTAMPDKCKVAITFELPKGAYAVRDCRRGKIYVDIDGKTYEFDNIYDKKPLYVYISKTKKGYVLKKEK